MEEIALSCAEKPLDEVQLRAAQLVAEGELTEDEIAEQVDRARRTVQLWKKLPEFRARVAELVKELEVAILDRGIARRGQRVARLDDTWRRLRQVVDERAADPAMQTVAGGKTGLLVRHLKQIGGGETAQVVEEFEVDTGLLRELREHEKQAAIELGQWVRKMAPTDPTGEKEYGDGLTDEERRAEVVGILRRFGILAPDGPGVAPAPGPGAGPAHGPVVEPS